MKVVAIILTFNEEKHLERCIKSVQEIVDGILVLDCYSADKTVDVAIKLGASVLQKDWVNYSTQFNYALSQLDDDIDWVLRIDADEYLTSDLISEIKSKLAGLPRDIAGVYLPRRMTFMGCMIRHGGVFPVQVLRLFRQGAGKCENRWMDEHIKITGKTVKFENELIDDNLNSLTWWIDKHNNYASREVVDLLNLEYSFIPHDTVASLSSGSQASVKRWIKENVYARLPGGFRAFAYFFYRYFLRLGFLDGREGTAFHVLQGFWYRYLVDVKLYQVQQYIRKNNCDPQSAIQNVLGITLDSD
ncbi:glycosyltransferase family 2 protein [Haliea sp. E17]|uniref:glycosyltransferase family 2 protein n=1 Tax=Haliea sp. E17 TaxID=3401576 RepID=UPI003AB0DC5B